VVVALITTKATIRGPLTEESVSEVPAENATIGTHAEVVVSVTTVMRTDTDVIGTAVTATSAATPAAEVDLLVKGSRGCPSTPAAMRGPKM
jgi:predicted RecA/RadA family phage recombinase